MQKKKFLIRCAIGLIASVLIIALCLNISISGAPLDAGGCVTISFDKWDMQRADKAILFYNGETYIIDDITLVQALATETTAGTLSEYCCYNDNHGYLEIYRGDKLIRKMRYVQSHQAFAYEADLEHWVLFGSEAHAFISSETVQKLEAFINAN